MEVRITHLAPMRVAYTNAFGATPEADAWASLLAWAQEKGLLDDSGAYRLFGYDDPPEGENGLHGYDTWITVGAGIQDRPGEKVRIKDFPGGLYAVTRCNLADIIDSWTELHSWVILSRYQAGHHQWLEEHLTLPQAPWQDILLDLYHPIAE